MRLTALLLLIAYAPYLASANDTALSTGGAPKALRSHLSICMVSEVVRLDVGEDKVWVDCTFTFENTSRRSVTVRMGFPDIGYGALDPDEERRYQDRWRVSGPESTFDRFDSWVDGQKVPTNLFRSDRPGEFWHIKTVRFPGLGRRIVRDRYIQHIGFGPVGVSANRFGFAARAAYILHTGSSWHGRIGRSEVIVAFHRRRMTGTLRPTRIPPKGWFDGAPIRDWSGEAGRVFYTGPGRPTVHGKTMRFVRTNWRPTARDDVGLVFDLKIDP